ncbi:hypothetical protein ACJVDH_06540 [Pedobacter sp. AW1-32]|uniref:hypothetical protein n=1 Tax=Pedobacter sp. AW1-32 TaxID=3383026 RepID=UPI003FF02D9F
MKKTSVLDTEKNFPIVNLERTKTKIYAVQLSGANAAKNFQQQALQIMAGKTVSRVGQIKGEIKILTVKQPQNGLRGIL